MIGQPKRDLIDRWIDARLWLFLLCAVAAIAGGVLGARLHLDRSIENMFAPDDPILEPYRRLQRTFGEHDIVLLVYSEQDASRPAALEQLAATLADVRATDGVVAAVSLLDPPAASDFEDRGAGRRMRRAFSGYTHNDDLDALGIVCLVARPKPGGPPRRATLAGLRAIAEQLPDGTIVGETVLVEEAFDMLEADGARLNLWCTALLVAVILLCFHRLRWVVLPLVVVQMTLAVTRGTLVAAGLRMSMVSSMLSAIVTVVGVATVVHIIVRYRDAAERGLAPRDALRSAWGVLAAPVAFACLTDAAGFAALLSSRVGPVQDFGLMMALGSIAVLMCVVLVTPLVVLFGARTTQPVAAPAEGRMQAWLGRLLDWSIKHRIPLLLAGAVLTVAGAAGSLRLELETSFIRNFRSDSHLAQSYGFVEDRFGGAGVWDVIQPAPRALDPRAARSLLKLEAALKEQCPELTKILSLATVIHAGTGGLPDANFTASIAIRSSLGLMRKRIPEFVDTLQGTDPEDGRPWLRMLLRSPERMGASEKSQLIDDVASVATSQNPEAEVTGYYVLLTRLIESLLADQWITFAVAVAAMAVMMLVALRSVRLTVAVLVPNVLPVLVLFGAMGWLGVRVNMGVAMIAAVSLGLSIDGSIHYSMSYRRARREGLGVIDALRATQSTVGRAAVFATLALVVGFSTLCTSDFVPTVYFGALVSLSMIGGLVGNVVALPVLIHLVER